MRIKDYFIDKSFLSLTAPHIFGSWSRGPGSWVLILDYALRKMEIINSYEVYIYINELKN